jgi:Tfp pilus assembly PilM family ATPase
MVFAKAFLLDPETEPPTDQIPWEIDLQSVGLSGRRVFDWEPLPRDAGTPEGSGGSAGRYLVAATDEQRLHFLTAALKKGGLNAKICDVDIFALANIFTQSMPAESGGLTALIHACTHYASLCLVRDGAYVDSDFISGFNLENEENAPAAAQAVMVRLGDMLNAAYDRQPDRVVLSGEVLAAPAVRERLVECLGLQNLLIIEPFKQMDIDDEVRDQVESIAPGLAVAAGLTLRVEEAPGL